MNAQRIVHMALVLLLLHTNSECAQLTLEWATVGDPGNAADDTGFGAVSCVYLISKHEVTNSQYAAFLNAVAATDTNDLYNIKMDPARVRFGGIARSGNAAGSYTYTAQLGREDKPVDWVSFYDTLRFSNWLHNGQPTGFQDTSTTEDGAYTITTDGLNNNNIARNPGARFFLPSEDEWYKAAYYKGGGTHGGYWEYPTGTDSWPTAQPPPGGLNSANFDFTISDFTDRGAYTSAVSPYGTFDQGGNAFEWNEAIVGYWGAYRGIRGGSALHSGMLDASYRHSGDPFYERASTGFRVARSMITPEPASLTLLASGIVILILWRRPLAQ